MKNEHLKSFHLTFKYHLKISFDILKYSLWVNKISTLYLYTLKIINSSKDVRIEVNNIFQLLKNKF